MPAGCIVFDVPRVGSRQQAATGQCAKEARSASKTASSQGRVMAASWSKPNSSSAIRRSTRNCGCSRQAMGTTNRHRLSPTYTGKCPLGTTSCCRRPRLEHRLTICFRLADCAIFLAIADYCLDHENERYAQTT
ncbi:hypothetical protein C2845_PM12G13420 [Panicum miliaceum]|uniref:Uncharacterized protein n=1 Tax=Panicum miliaceum TaxID=4540 RepID=A0A3L6QIT1_PANMI|nr:hypothetical protein C2845_PM12G13420 [Panicum miliaceum]